VRLSPRQRMRMGYRAEEPIIVVWRSGQGGWEAGKMEETMRGRRANNSEK
jgi:hypothetical protein